MQVLDILTSAARLVGSLAPGETLNASETTDFFQRLNDRIDELNADRLNQLPPVATALAAASAKSTYTVGPAAADFPLVPRPVLIQSLSHTVGGIEHDVELVSSDNFAAIRDRAATSVVVLKAFCDYGNPIATIKVWPVPSATPTFSMFAWTVIAQFATTFDTVTLPPGWAKFLQWDLAVQIAADLGTPPDILSMLVPQANAALMNMRALNQQYVTTAKGNAMLADIPTLGVPRTTGTMAANPQPGGPLAMMPIPGAQ
jgi:hypothetical protein